jgi:hypothetical protein
MVIVFFIIGLVVLVAAIVLIVWFFRTVIKAAILIALVVLILLGITGYLAYKDAMDLKDNLASSPSLYLFNLDDEIAAGFEASMEEAEDAVFLDAGQLAAADENFAKKKHKDILEDNYKLFIFNRDAFEAVESVEMDGEAYSKESIYEFLGAGNPAEEKGRAFGALLTAAEGDKPVLFVMSQYKKGNIDIYPETIILDLFKIMPLSWLEKYIGVDK